MCEAVYRLVTSRPQGHPSPGPASSGRPWLAEHGGEVRDASRASKLQILRLLGSRRGSLVCALPLVVSRVPDAPGTPPPTLRGQDCPLALLIHHRQGSQTPVWPVGPQRAQPVAGSTCCSAAERHEDSAGKNVPVPTPWDAPCSSLLSALGSDSGRRGAGGRGAEEPTSWCWDTAGRRPLPPRYPRASGRLLLHSPIPSPRQPTRPPGRLPIEF